MFLVSVFSRPDCAAFFVAWMSKALGPKYAVSISCRLDGRRAAAVVRSPVLRRAAGERALAGSAAMAAGSRRRLLGDGGRGTAMDSPFWPGAVVVWSRDGHAVQRRPAGALARPA